MNEQGTLPWKQLDDGRIVQTEADMQDVTVSIFSQTAAAFNQKLKDDEAPQHPFSPDIRNFVDEPRRGFFGYLKNWFGLV